MKNNKDYLYIKDLSMKKSRFDKVSFYLLDLASNELEIYNDYLIEKIKGKEIVFK